MPLPPSDAGMKRFRHPTNATRNRILHETYGFGLFPLPAYAPYTQEEEWEIRAHGPGLSRGYLARLVPEPGRHVLYRHQDAWMSTGLMEQESHAPHVAFANGIVVTAGLGLGLFTYAVLQKKTVSRVVVVETEPKVIRLLERAAAPERWSEEGRLHFVLGDILAPETAQTILHLTDGNPPDYLYADIWPVFPDPEAPEQTAAMVRMLQPAKAGWWGQELSFAQWCAGEHSPLDQAALHRYAAHCRVPLDTSASYATFCHDVARTHSGPPRSTGFLSALWRSLRGKKS